MNDTFTQIFVARKVKSREDESLIYVRLTLNQERKEFGLRIRIKSSEWDSKTQRLKANLKPTKLLTINLSLLPISTNVFSAK